MKILKAVAESRCLEHCKVIITPYFLDNRIEFRYAHAAVDNGGKRKRKMMGKNGNFWNIKDLYLLHPMNHYQIV
jgi:hypothetical protein